MSLTPRFFLALLSAFLALSAVHHVDGQIYVKTPAVFVGAIYDARGNYTTVWDGVYILKDGEYNATGWALGLIREKNYLQIFSFS